jgi:EAL domain-containing protein (putative c-di-GMP-specific phosphodiesterase class I)
MLLDEQGGVLETLNQLQTLGIAIAIDDFGTGYSSLSYLARYPINTLKIDRIFVTDIAVDPHRAELVRAIISIARNLKLSVVAEGVDTKEQAANLRQMGCQIAQGYLYSKPLPKATFQPLLTSFGKASNLGNTGKWMKHLSLMSH